jgi:hypothetical protein
LNMPSQSLKVPIFATFPSMNLLLLVYVLLS